MNFKTALLGVVLIWITFLALLFLTVRRECHGQCFQTHDRGCQDRCAAKEFCPMAGGDQ